MLVNRLLLLLAATVSFMVQTGKVILDQSNSAKVSPPSLNTSSAHLKISSAQQLKGVLSDRITSNSPDCGANALYVFLRLRGIGRTLSEVRKEVPLTALGASMLDLKKVANRLGVNASVINTSSSGLVDRVPAIARMQVKGNADRGHYVVVTQGDDKVFHVIDGTTGIVIQVTRATFDREFSGYALVAKSTTLNGLPGAVNFFLAFLCGVELLVVVILKFGRSVVLMVPWRAAARLRPQS